MTKVINIPDTDSSEFYFDLASGKIPEKSSVLKFSTNENVSNAWEDVWSRGGTLTHLTTAAQLEAISSSTNDTALGTGARTIQVEGLDADFNLITEILTMNGTSASVSTTQAFIRVFRCFIVVCGTYGGVNAGTITIRVAGAGVAQAEIPLIEGVGASQTLMSHYTTPANATAYIVGMHYGVGANKVVNVSLETRENADNTTVFSPWRIVLHLHGISVDSSLIPPVPIKIPPKTDIRVRAIEAAGSGAEVTFDYQIVLVEGVS